MEVTYTHLISHQMHLRNLYRRCKNDANNTPKKFRIHIRYYFLWNSPLILLIIIETYTALISEQSQHLVISSNCQLFYMLTALFVWSWTNDLSEIATYIAPTYPQSSYVFSMLHSIISNVLRSLYCFFNWDLASPKTNLNFYPVN